MNNDLDGSAIKNSASIKSIPLTLALFPVVVLIGLLVANVYFYGDSATFGPNQIALLMSAAAAALAGFFLGVPVKTMIEGVQKSIGSALIAMLILLLIGSLIGTWVMSGIVPAMIYYGLGILSPEYFLFAAAIVCAIVSVVTGSSWSTVATVGIALLGIGSTMGIHQGLIAGAIISGAYFGDKISPLSDTTNLAAAMAGTDLITHIRYMMWTTIPSFAIALGIYLVIGLNSEPPAMATDTEQLKLAIDKYFNLNPIVFIVPVGVLVMVLMKVDALVALFVGAVAGGVLAICIQPEAVSTISGLAEETVTIVVDESGTEQETTRKPPYYQRAYKAFINAMAMETTAVKSERIDELKARKAELAEQAELSGDAAGDGGLTPTPSEATTTELAQIDAELAAADLLKGKGMVGMLNTIWLIITAMCFGGLMEACGLLQRITQPLVDFATSTGALVSTTAGSCLFLNVTASDQYLAIVVPGRMFRETYRDRGLAPQNLSRTLEDSGTVTSVLVPWNTCGAAQQGVLGVEVIAFAPFCFFNIISPFMTILFAWLGIAIAKLPSDSDATP